MRKFDFKFESKTKPFPHQVEAINYVQERATIALFDEQGLGKTKIVIEALCNNIKSKLIDGALIICRKSLIQTWQDEINTHSFLNSIVLRGSPREKGIKFMGFVHFYVINYESVPGELERLKMFLKIRKMAVVLDESHAIKNPESKSSQAILQLATLTKKRIIISGTPVANKPEDLWNQFYFLDEGLLLGKNYSEFKSRYSPNLKDTESLIKKENFVSLRDLISSHSIRRKKHDVLELPEKSYYDRYVELTGKQLTMYEQLRDELRIEIMNLQGNVVIDESDELIKKLLRLGQIASNPKLIDQSYDEEPAKFRLLNQLIEEIISRKEKLIIWSCFVDNITYLNRYYSRFGSQMIYGEIPIERRSLVVRKFKTDDNCMILFANPAAAREGLTLTVANNAIYLDRNFNLVDYLQSQDRIHRISQTKPCSIFKLIAKNTIDEYIDEILKRKHYLANYLQGDADAVEFSQQLTKDELLTFLGTSNNG
jgi:SWI/SNF-related matrix-associated actin-dependent regulator 1 of chromatin subfamily A